MSRTNVVKAFIVCAAVVAVALASSPAQADQTMCGSVSAVWNVPNGGAVFSSGNGPVKQVLKAVGEYRSHSMLSNGPGGWVTHTGSKTPPSNGDMSPYYTPFCSSCGSECWNPLDVNFLHNSTPGMEQVLNGAIYAYIYADTAGGDGSYWRTDPGNSSGGNVESSDDNWVFISYQNAKKVCSNGTWIDQPNMIGNKAWAGGSIPNTNYSVGFQYPAYGGTASYRVTYNGAPVPYGWNQYMNTQGAAAGFTGLDNGLVCSSSLAFWQHAALAGDGAYTGDVIPRTYNSGTITNGAYALWNAVYNECQGSMGWFSSIGSFFTNLGFYSLCAGVTGLWQGPCGQAADQMVNCFATNNCGNTSSPDSYWQGYTSRNNGTTQWMAKVASSSSVAISPDAIACWHGNGTGAPCSGNGSSVWGWDTNNAVQWNGGGSYYGCWD